MKSINILMTKIIMLHLLRPFRTGDPISNTKEHLTSTMSSVDCQTRIPLIFHQTFKERQLPTQYVFSVASIARNHRIAYNDTSGNEPNCVFFKYYFWTDESIKEFVEDERRFNPLFTKMESGLQLARLADFAYYLYYIVKEFVKVQMIWRNLFDLT